MSFQERVNDWMLQCFGAQITYDQPERNFRFLEESLELVQATGCTKEEALKLVEYVFSRPVGELNQEVGGVMVTLAALCEAHEIHMDSAAAVEIARCWKNTDKIREKQAGKPKLR